MYMSPPFNTKTPRRKLLLPRRFDFFTRGRDLHVVVVAFVIDVIRAVWPFRFICFGQS